MKKKLIFVPVLMLLALPAFLPGFTLTTGEMALAAFGLVGLVLLASAAGS